MFVLACAISSACKNDESAHGFTPTEPMQLSQNPGKDEDPTVILAHDGTFYVAWFSDQDGNNEIWLTSSTDGKKWVEPFKIISHPAEDLYPQLIQASNGTFFLSWFRIAFDDDLQAYTFHVWFAKSADAINWENEQQLSEASSTFNWVPFIMEDQSGRIWVAYTSGRLDLNKEIYLLFSDNEGQHWDGDRSGSPLRLTNMHFQMTFLP